MRSNPRLIAPIISDLYRDKKIELKEEIRLPLYKMSIVIENAYIGNNRSVSSEWVFKYNLFSNLVTITKEL